MTTQEQYIARLREIVQTKFGRRITTMEDCDALSEAVGEATNIKLDSRAYMPIFNAGVAPRPVALSTLARYLGYSSWGDFCASSSVVPAEDADVIPVVRRWGVIVLTALAIIVVIGAIIFLLMWGGESNDARRIEPIIADVEERWVARTMEECNALRAYRADSTYVDMLNNFAVGYDTVLQNDVARHIHAAVKEHGIAVNDSEIEMYSDSITSRCKSMYEVLYLE